MLKKLCKGLLWSVALTLGLVLGFAFIIKQANLDDAIIKPVVQGIKVLCILVGVGITIRNTTGRGWLWGGIVGILYTVLAFCIFSAIDGTFVVDISALNDLVFAMIIGIISAMALRGRKESIEA
ncbi:MAG: TIGR04086 family membrane protein [Christensenellaceae bacterium]|jgi:putative membrane protein (TIGR04086 family)|nr:TIGR04086 family membrane protein [Christensenellaceae bacterium]